MQTEQQSGVVSKPVYQAVELNPKSTFHLFIAEESVPTEMAELFESCESAKDISVFTDASDPDLVGLLSEFPLRGTLYLAGKEPFIWRVASQARQLGLCSEQIRMFTPVTKERHLFCCHCYTVTEGVTYSPYTCSGCGRSLVVSDHFARLHSAYFGYQVNAEDSSDMPEPMEVN